MSRHIAEKYVVGRRLRRDEVVHHKNRNKLDNRPENLEVMTRGEHADLHHIDSGDCFCSLSPLVLVIVPFPFSLIAVIIWWWFYR